MLIWQRAGVELAVCDMCSASADKPDQNNSDSNSNQLSPSTTEHSKARVFFMSSSVYSTFSVDDD